MTKTEKDQRTVRMMIALYCTHKLKNEEDRKDYAEVADYACRRLEHCSFGDNKPACKNCPIHCYAPQKREMMRKVMRWAGPRMLLYSPKAFFRHLANH